MYKKTNITVSPKRNGGIINQIRNGKLKISLRFWVSWKKWNFYPRPYINYTNTVRIIAIIEFDVKVGIVI